MRQGIQTLLTLGVLTALLVAAVIWGYQALTAPLPGDQEEAVDIPTCEPTEVAAGEVIEVADVTVSVVNAGSRSGLAGRTLSLLTDAGFVAGSTANAPEGTSVQRVAIFTADRNDPAIPLVRSWLGKAEVRNRPDKVEEIGAPGVIVVVGDRFQQLAKGRPSVKARRAGTSCLIPDTAGGS